MVSIFNHLSTDASEPMGMLVHVAIEKLVPVLDRASNQQYMHCTTQYLVKGVST